MALVIPNTNCHMQLLLKRELMQRSPCQNTFALPSL